VQGISGGACLPVPEGYEVAIDEKEPIIGEADELEDLRVQSIMN
jgi:hypothetical protein